MQVLRVILAALVLLLIASLAGWLNGSNGSYISWGIGAAIVALLAYMMLWR